MKEHNRERGRNRIQRCLYKGIIGYLFFLILLALLFLAAISTSFVDAEENIYFVKDSVVGNIAGLFIALALSLSLYHAGRKYGKIRAFFERVETEDRFFRRIKWSILLCYGAAAVLWVLSTQIIPGGDQMLVMQCAHELAERNVSPEATISYYLSYYNNQVGIVVAEWLLGYMTGFLNYQAFQVLNAGAVVGILLQLSELGGMFGMNRKQQLAVLLLGALYPPLLFYTNFVYGTLPGLLLSVMAIKYELRFLRGGTWHEAMVSALCIGFAVMLKMNYLIFMIAMLLYAMMEGIGGRARRALLLAASVITALLLQITVPKMCVERRMGRELSDGFSTWSWITMGLTDGDAPGWWNGYNTLTYLESDYDTQKQEAWVRSDLKLRLEEMMSDRDAARSFFVRKTASQWNEPTLQSLWCSYVRDSALGHVWADALLTERGNGCLTKIMSYVQYVIVFGGLLYVILCRGKEEYYESLLLPMVVIGGFIFHLVWEAKGQYIFPYFILLLPYTVMGFGEATEKLGALLCKSPDKGSIAWLEDRKSLLKDALLFVIAILILWVVFHGTVDSLTSDADRYLMFLDQQLTGTVQ